MNIPPHPNRPHPKEGIGTRQLALSKAYKVCRKAGVDAKTVHCCHYSLAQRSPIPGNTNWGERLGTVDLLFKVACFVNNVNHIFNIKGADLNKLVQGGQLYWPFPFSKVFLSFSLVSLLSLTSGFYYKDITIINSTSRVVRMTIISDTTTWSITYGQQLCSRVVNYSPREHL
jgi:hypothetical protein